MESGKPPRTWRWMTLASGVIGSAVSSGVVSIVIFGMSLKLIAADFGWYRSQVSVGLICFYLFNGIGALMLGQLSVRFGVRWPATAYVVAFASAILLVAALPPSLFLFVLAFIWLGLTSGGCGSMPYAIGIAGWFDRGRGLALAIAVSGTGLGHIFVPGYAEWLISNFGWRGAYVGVAAYVAFFGLLALLIFYREPPGAPRAPKMDLGGFIGIYREYHDIRLLAVSIFLISFASIGMSVSLPPILTDRGFSTRDAAIILTIYGAANWIAKLATGVLLDHIHVRYVAAAIFALVAAAGAILLTEPSLYAVYIAAALIGCGVGAEADIMSYGASRYCERAILGKAIGAIWLLMPWGAGIGVLAGTGSFDMFGSYQIALIAYTLMAAGAATVILQAGPYRDWPRSQAGHGSPP